MFIKDRNENGVPEELLTPTGLERYFPFQFARPVSVPDEYEAMALASTVAVNVAVAT
jgi:hypothetical protein